MPGVPFLTRAFRIHDLYSARSINGQWKKPRMKSIIDEMIPPLRFSFFRNSAYSSSVRGLGSSSEKPVATIEFE